MGVDYLRGIDLSFKRFCMFFTVGERCCVHFGFELGIEIIFGAEARVVCDFGDGHFGGGEKVGGVIYPCLGDDLGERL